MSWDGTTGSLIGCFTESAEIGEWERQLGLPGWLAYALEAASAAVDPVVVLGLTQSVLHAVSIGTDVSLKGSVVVRAILLEAVTSLEAEPIDPMLTNALDLLCGLHTRACQGDDIESSEWRSARKFAVAATEAQRSPASQAVARCVESAGWNPLNSQTAVADVIRSWVKVKSLNDVPYPWTKADDDHMRQLLKATHEKYHQHKDFETKTVFHFLEIDHPAEAKRLRESNTHGTKLFAAWNVQALKLLTTSLKQQP